KNGEPVAIYNTWKMRAHIVGGALDFGGGGIFMTRIPLENNKDHSLIGKASYFNPEDHESCYYYDFEDAFEGKVHFTKIDTVNYIVSGTFDFSTATENCDTLRITHGRFDMRYSP